MFNKGTRLVQRCLLALVLQKLISTIDGEDERVQLLLQAWYLDDGVLAGKRSAVLRALHLIEELGPHIGLVLDFSKRKVFSPQGNHLFPPAVKSSLSPHLEILGIWDISCYAGRETTSYLLIKELQELT